MTSPSKKMDVELPNSVIAEEILTRVPIQDAIRTSLVSKNWRPCWKSMTKLVFDDKMVKVPSNSQELKRYKLALAILNVLSSHKGSILEIKIDVRELDVDSEFDLIILNLSRRDHLKKLRLMGSLKCSYKLPSSFFSFQGLEFLVLVNCVFRPPMNFDGFKKLHTVRFGNVDITSETLQFFLSKCPLLRDLALVGGSRGFAARNRLTFVELLQCVPLIEILKIRGPYMECLSAGGMPHNLPTSLDKLKCLYLGVCFDVADELSSTLRLIRSSPNLEELGLMGRDKSNTAQSSENFPGIQDDSGFTLDHLDFFWMKNFVYEKREVEFLKLIMAKSPMLKKAEIELDKSISCEEENEILKDLLQLRFPCASASAKLIFKSPKPAS